MNRKSKSTGFTNRTWARRAELAQHPDYVLGAIREGTEKARIVTDATNREMMESVGLLIH